MMAPQGPALAAGPGPDSLRRVLDSVFADPRYTWHPRPDPFEFIRVWFARAMDWFAALATAHPVDFRLVVIAMSLLLAALLLHIGWIVFHTIRPAPPTVLAAGTIVYRDRDWFVGEADRLARRGRYPEAAQAAFVALVMALDARHVVAFHPSKTPGEYLTEARLAAPERNRFRELVGDLYGYAFARRPITAGDYAEWRSRAEPERYADAH